jgi:hypothetical protein
MSTLNRMRTRAERSTTLSSASVYFSESGFFNELRPIQIKISPISKFVQGISNVFPSRTRQRVSELAPVPETG